MFGVIWKTLFGELDMTQVSAILAAVGYVLSRIADYLKQRKEEKRLLADTCIEDAITSVAKEENVKLDKVNDIGKIAGENLLNAAVQTALALGKSRGVNVPKALGGEASVKAATQTMFKKIKSALARDK